MNRTQFFQALNESMNGLPEAERNRLLDYYAEYFHDMLESGMTEEEVSASLDAPHVIADKLRAELGYGPSSRWQQAQATPRPDGGEPWQPQPVQSRTMSHRWIFVVLLVFGAPMWIGLLAGIFGLVAGVIGAIVGLVFGGVAALLAGIWYLFSWPIGGVMMIGGGLMLVGITLLLISLTRHFSALARRCWTWVVSTCKTIVDSFKQGGRML